MNAEKKHIVDELNKRPAPLPGDNYFAQLKSEVLGKAGPGSVPMIRSGKPIFPLEGGQRRVIRPWQVLTAAASVVLIVTLYALNGYDPPARRTQAETPEWNSVSQDELVAYIHENIDDFETEAIAVHLDSIPLWNTGEVGGKTTEVRPAEPAKPKDDRFDELFRDIDREDILEYLDDEEIGLEDELIF